MGCDVNHGAGHEVNHGLWDVAGGDVGGGGELVRLVGMTPEELSELIARVVADAAGAGTIDLQPDDIPSTVKVERPRNRDHGDWSTNVAMQLAKKARTNPRQLGEAIAEGLRGQDGIEAVDVAGPGFVNITLGAGAQGEIANTILAQGEEYGQTDKLAGSTVNLEYVSANPTGPIHLGGARWAAVGDSLSRLLSATGADVVREYYFNDAGAQIDRFASSLLARARDEEIPEDGYGGAYIDEIAGRVIADEEAAGRPNPAELDDEKALDVFHHRGVELMFAEIKKTLAEFGAEFDVFFHEDSLHESGAVDRAIEILAERGHIFTEDGATWVRTTSFGDDKDRVVVKSDGRTAYFAGDIAYYLDKRQRGADRVIIMLGADHHGYIGRMYAMARAFGDTAGPGQNLEILIGQLVNLLSDGEPVRMSKRAGTVVTLDDLVDAVGVDAARYALVRSSVDTSLDLDIELLASQTNDNPVFYVQYAHARTRSVSRNAAEAGIDREDFDPAALDHPKDGELAGTLARFPAVVTQAAELSEPHRIARYLEEVASSYHAWYGSCRVIPRAGEDVTEGHRARLALNDATTQVLANGLRLLGVSAPERM